MSVCLNLTVYDYTFSCEWFAKYAPPRREQTLAKLEEQNRTRSDNLNGRLDQVIKKLR